MHLLGFDCLISNYNLAINKWIIILHLHIKYLFQFLMLSAVCMYRRGLGYILVLLIYPAALCSEHTDTAFLADAVSTQTIVFLPWHLAFSRSAASWPWRSCPEGCWNCGDWLRHERGFAGRSLFCDKHKENCLFSLSLWLGGKKLNRWCFTERENIEDQCEWAPVRGPSGPERNIIWAPL